MVACESKNVNLFSSSRYLVDLSRMFPAVTKSDKLAQYYQLFRPEFLAQYKEKLCNDVYSPFLDESEEELWEEKTQEAKKYLEKELIPSFAQTPLVKFCNVCTGYLFQEQGIRGRAV